MKTYLPFILSLLLFLSNCSLDIPLEDQVGDPDAVTTVTAGEKLLASAYRSYTGHSYIFELSLMSDDLCPTPLMGRKTDIKLTYQWNERAILSLAKEIWESSYATIMKCNAILERLPNIPTYSKKEKLELAIIKERAKRLKAICYFDLLRTFSPSFEKTNPSTNMGILVKDNISLSNHDRVTMDSSLAIIRKLLTPEITVEENNTPTWISAKAAQYIHAELELWAGKYKEVLQYALPLIQNLDYSTFSQEQTKKMWSKQECGNRIFALNIQDATNHQLYLDIQYSKKIGDYAIINENIQYSPKDNRNGIYRIISNMSIQGSQTPREVSLLGKYNKQNREGEEIKYFNRCRTAGLIFICAEAYVHLNKKKEALKILNKFLQQKGADAIDQKIKEEKLIDRILKEKQKEFIGEGERFFDLKRTKSAVQRYRIFLEPLIKIEAADYKWTFPIPTSETKYNKKITQNKGWEHINRNF